YMLGAYFAFSVSRIVGFWPALGDRPRPLRRAGRPHRDVRDRRSVTAVSAAGVGVERPRVICLQRGGQLVDEAGLLPDVPLTVLGGHCAPDLQLAKTVVDRLWRDPFGDLGADRG